MHVRISSKQRAGRTYRYVQLVQSYRRDDGVPAHRVLANLGDLPAAAVGNLRLALQASRDDQQVVVAPDVTGTPELPSVQANLRYLDAAVVWQSFRDLGLGGLLAELLPRSEAVVSAADVIGVLVAQRCLCPRSTLHAQRWFPTTALPELLGIAPGQFNNTRFHRVLDALHQIQTPLQERLAARYQEQLGPFVTMFMDVTDTWFEGNGCPMAEAHRTKAGHRNKQSIGIVLLAQQDGLPLRWQVVPGKTHDDRAMRAMAEGLAGVPWARGIPLVMDRAMGRGISLSALMRNELYFLTAASVNCIESHTTKLPHEAFAALALKETRASRDEDLARALQAAHEAGLRRVDDQLFVLDLGVVQTEPLGSCEDHARQRRQRRAARAVTRLQEAREIQQGLHDGTYRTHRDAAHKRGISKTQLTARLGLLRLAPDLQQRVLLLAESNVITEKFLYDVSRIADLDEQRRRLNDLLPPLPTSPLHSSKAPDAASATQRESLPDRLRMVAYFNPSQFVDKRRRAREYLEEIRQFVADLNEDLRQAKIPRHEESTRRKLVRKLEKDEGVDLFKIKLSPIEVVTRTGTVKSFRCTVELQEPEWQRRRRYDGFVLLLAHPQLLQTAEELALLYRAKDAVEKDFQSIKSVLKLRPIYHFTDLKVEAHVTICMLALLLQRYLERRLRAGRLPMSAPAALELLSTCHLNQFHLPSAAPVYSVTALTPDQRRILAALGLAHLADSTAVARAITPRVVST